MRAHRGYLSACDCSERMWKKNVRKCTEEDKRRSFSSVGNKARRCPCCMVKKPSQPVTPPPLPEQPRCIIDLCFYFTPAIPKKGEVLEDSGRLRGDQSVCVRLNVAAVGADGWAGLVWNVFFFVPSEKPEARRPYTVGGNTAALPLKDLSQCFLLVLLKFSGEFDKISNAHFFCWPQINT